MNGELDATTNFKAIDVEDIRGIIWVTQPEEVCGIPVSFFKTDM